MSEIAVYIEGGGATAGQKAELRRGFEVLFERQKSKAYQKGHSLRFVCCGSRNEAYEAFRSSLTSNASRVSALLVDSEGPIAGVPTDEAADDDIRVSHLRRAGGTGGRGQGDSWVISDEVADRVHLMVQCMEAWIVADPDALEGFYNQGFKRSKLPVRQNLEEEPKVDIYSKLDSATKETQKGSYGKIKHASELLKRIGADKVAGRCQRFRIFQAWLDRAIG